MDWEKVREAENIKAGTKIKRNEFIAQWYKIHKTYSQKSAKFFSLTEPVINQIAKKAFDDFITYFTHKRFNVEERTIEYIAAITGEAKIEFKKDAKNLYGIYYYLSDNLNNSVSFNIELSKECTDLYNEKRLDPISEHSDLETAKNQLNAIRENIKIIENKITNFNDLKFVIKIDNNKLSNSNGEYNNITEILDAF